MRVRIFSALCSLLVLSSWLGSHHASAQTSTLRLSLPISIDSPIGQNIGEFARQVEARTGGSVRIEIQGKDRRSEEHEVVPAVASGAIEIGATTLNQFAYDVPLAGAFLQPFLFNFDALAQAATSRDSQIRAMVEEEVLDRTKTRVLWWLPFGSRVIVARKIPATDPAVLSANIVGAPDDQTRELIRACGGAPNIIAPRDIFFSLKTGAATLVVTDIMTIREQGLWQVADTITDLRLEPSLFLVVINEKAWQSLAPKHRQILREAAQDAQVYMWAGFAPTRMEAYTWALQKGMTIVAPRPDDIAAWRACSAPLLEAYMERAGDAGPKLFAAYGQLRTEPCCREIPGDAPFSQR
jgi:C4-dicarboxylate-binding protein DctP